MRAFHPYAEIFPAIEGNAFVDFCAGIKEHGLLFPIILHRDGRVLDGKNRERACEETGTKPFDDTFEQSAADVAASKTYDESALDFAMTANADRRHLTDGQRACAAIEYKKHFAIEAAKRQKAGKADSTKISATERRSDTRAAKAAGSTRSKVNAAEKILAAATPEDVEAVRTGKKTLKQIAPKPERKVKPTTAEIFDTFAILQKDVKVFVASIKLATITVDDFTPEEVKAIKASFEKVNDGMDAFVKARTLAETRSNSKLIKNKGDSLADKAFAVELRHQ